jgi:hypothetical protein
LGAEAIEPALAEMWFDDIFSATLVALMQGAGGRLRAYVPQGVDRDRAMQFRSGGLLREGQPHLFSDGTSLVAVESLIEARDRRFWSLLASDPGAACVVPEYNPRISDLNPPSEPTVFWAGDRCFHWVDQEANEPSLIETFAKAELPWCGIAAVCRPSGGARRATDTNETGLRRLAEAAIEISLRAYDGESFLIWSRADTNEA